MPQSACTPDELLSYIPYPVSTSSESLGWQHIRVEVWRKPPPEGEILCPGGTHHELIVPLCGGNTTVRNFADRTWSSNRDELLAEYDFIPAGCDNRWEWRGGSCEYASFDIDPGFIGEAFEVHNPLSLIPRLGWRGGQVRRIATFLVQELETGGVNGLLHAESLMIQLGAQLLRSGGVLKSRSSRIESDCRVARTIDYIRSNLHAPLILSELARIAGLSQWHFCVAFRLATNASPRQFVMGQRVQCA
ncbi:MAG: helix-turn-helix transcriptional regulator, partial [Acidobacteria bacterium]|nr:helix-turn-helix transcriptional regulator [Acidobacteriota bacterium]